MKFLRLAVLAGLIGSAMAIGGARAATLQVELSSKTGSPLADAVIYAIPDSKTPMKAPGTAEIDQIKRTFVPKVTILQTGTSVTFPNKDNIEHDVYSFSSAKTFELKLYSGVPAHPVVFDKPGLVTLGCNIHDQMIAYVMVVDTSFFAKADEHGIARIEGLPPGNYEIKAWHYSLPDGTALPSRRVTISTDQTIKFPLDAASGGSGMMGMMGMSGSSS